ncbi:MAG: FAD-dependent monooxygenase [Paramuribaculum sp.]|nr:FAD-dependent monooxygenase [Paramuribaculum sp.]
MIENLQLRVEPAVAASQLRLIEIASSKLGIDANRIKDLVITRRSIDARQRKVAVELGVRVYIDEKPDDTTLCKPESFKPLGESAPQAIVVGAGPAGLFAALRLIQLGIRPIVIERGKNVDDRRKDMALIAREGKVDSNSNYCFGEGGAGAYSDGKLYTRSKKRGSISTVLNILCQHGADESILIDAHPHIGTDKLPEVIKAIRKTIEKCGGKVLFSTKMTDLIIENDKVVGVDTTAGSFHGPVILATGHSARDVYNNLVLKKISMEPKGIAVGVRLEHPQHLIDSIRYHNPAGRGKYLPPAEYTMLTRMDNRAVYSFCMCPGGFIIPAASEPGQIVVNGMSPSNRGTKWANSGMVVEVLPQDIEDTPGEPSLKVMRFQEKIERAFFEEGDGSQNAPAQRMTDFVNARQSTSLPQTSYAPGIHSARVDNLLPEPISSRLRKGFEEFGRKNRGFLTPDATVIGCETRTSAPVRVIRDEETMQSLSHADLFPCGEGAGYAGGIVSAAVDGIRCAEALAKTIN